MARKRLTHLLREGQDPAEAEAEAEPSPAPASRTGRSPLTALKASLAEAERRVADLQGQLQERDAAHRAEVERLHTELEKVQKEALQLALANTALIEEVNGLRQSPPAKEPNAKFQPPQKQPLLPTYKVVPRPIQRAGEPRNNNDIPSWLL